MKNLEVISTFVDRRTGDTIQPGADVPEGLDSETIQRLMRARCLAVAQAGTRTASKPKAKAETKAEAKAKTKETADKKNPT